MAVVGAVLVSRNACLGSQQQAVSARFGRVAMAPYPGGRMDLEKAMGAAVALLAFGRGADDGPDALGCPYPVME